MNMLATIVPKSDQLNADDLIGQTKTITISKVSINPTSEQPVSIHFDGDQGKPYKPGKSMRRVLVKVWGPDANAYAGRTMTLYRDDGVRFGGVDVGGIRISHMTDIDAPVVMALTEKKGSKKPFQVKPLKQERQAQAAPAADSGPDKATQVADALVHRAQNSTGMQALTTMTGDATVIKQRAWLTEKRPELAQRVTDAVQDALSRFESDDTFPGDLPSAEQGEAA